MLPGDAVYKPYHYTIFKHKRQLCTSKQQAHGQKALTLLASGAWEEALGEISG
jgi:hypothetical protein